MLERLRTAIDDFLATDFDALSDAELRDVVTASEREEARLAVAYGRFVDEWTKRHGRLDEGTDPAHPRMF